MKKTVLIIISSYEIGGTISSLRSLLSAIDAKEIEFTIFARSQVGPNEGLFHNCKVLNENLWLSNRIYHRSFVVKLLVRLLWLIRHSLKLVGVDMFKIYNHIGGKQIHSESYDVIIGYDETLARFISYLPAKRRIGWIHCDYRRFAKGINETKYYDRIDSIVCVSEYAKSVFCEVYPQYALKTYAIHNAVDWERIKKDSDNTVVDSRFIVGDYTIVSCGRLDPVKQFSKIPEIAAKLKKMKALPFKWFIIGGGNEDEKHAIETEIARFQVEDCVIMLGMKKSVYPYMMNSDLYVCTSLSESFPMVINEAKALLIPVISNTFPSAKEIIRDGIDGYLCPIMDMANCILDQMIHPIRINADTYVDENLRIAEQFMDVLS